MTTILRWVLGLSIVLAAVTWPTLWPSHQAKEGGRLSEIGPALEFSLTAQDGRRVSMADLCGKIVVVAFIYASCADTCPLLTAKRATLQQWLGPDFGRNVAFVSITVDSERGTPEVLARYARAHGANSLGWIFLTGATDEIDDHQGIMRVRYPGIRFDPENFLRNLHSLLREARPL